MYSGLGNGGYPTCATQAELIEARANCHPVIAGLGALSGRFAGADPCWVQTLRPCVSMTSVPTHTDRGTPTDSGAGAGSGEDDQKKKLVIGGLVAALVVGGGIIAYRSMKKKR